MVAGSCGSRRDTRAPRQTGSNSAQCSRRGSRIRAANVARDGAVSTSEDGVTLRVPLFSLQCDDMFDSGCGGRGNVRRRYSVTRISQTLQDTFKDKLRTYFDKTVPLSQMLPQHTVHLNNLTITISINKRSFSSVFRPSAVCRSPTHWYI